MLSTLSFHLVGISHHTAGVEVRERVAFTPAEVVGLLEGERAAGRAAVLLSTCNRFEVYWTGDDDYGTWFRELVGRRGGDPECPLTCLDGIDAVRHLFTVGAGLDSQIVGETEILGQVRRAFDLARASGTTTRELDAVFSAALTAGRRVRHETFLGQHPISVSSAAIDVGKGHCGGSLTGRSAVVLGAGEVAEGTLRALHQAGVASVTLINRQPERAEALGAAWGVADVRGWEGLDLALRAADLVVVATAASHPVLSAADLALALAHRPGRGFCVIDLAVPRNVEPAARDLPGVSLFDLDDLQDHCCPASTTESPALLEARRIIEDELARLAAALLGRARAPQLTELHRFGAEVIEEETARALDQLDSLTDAERAVVRGMAERLARRLLYPVSRAVRRGDA